MTTASKLPKRVRKAWPSVRLEVARKTGSESWCVDARINGVGPRFFYPTKIEADTVAEQLRIRRINEGVSAFTMPIADRVDAEAALRELQPHGATLREATKFYLKHMDIFRRQILLADFIVELIAAKKADGISHYYFMSFRSWLRKFSREFPNAKLQDFTTDDLDVWLRARPVSPYTRNSDRLRLIAMFAFAKERRYIVENIAYRTAKAKEVERPVEFLTVAECTALLEACDDQFLPCVALGLFAGLRPYSEVCRLDWRHIDFESGLIDIEAARTKTARHRFVKMTDNLKEWLLPYRQTSGQIGFSAGVYMTRLQKARLMAGIARWPHDVLRHCFGTYHYTHFKNAGETAQEMGHSSMTMIYKHYRGRTKPVDAAKFWDIRPGRENNVVPMIAQSAMA